MDGMSLLDLAKQHLSSDDIQNISQQLGVDPATAQRAIDAALPMMVNGVSHTAQQPGGADALQGAMATADGASALGGIGGVLGGALGGVLGGVLGGAGGGGGGLGGILGSILGQHHDAVHDDVQQASGLDAGKVGKLLMLLAPFVLRALAKHQQQGA